MVSYDQLVMLGIDADDDMVAYLEDEARRRDISIEEAYRDEVEAKERAYNKLLSREELKIIARDGKPDSRYFVADDDPF